jgi:CheY-like chemotaxis protein
MKGTQITDPSALKESLADARGAAERIRGIVRDLKVFSRAEQEKRGPVDIERVMESTLRMASNEIRHRATLVRDYGKIPLVHASESRLGQVFLNLIVNAAQSIREGEADRNEIRISTRLAGNRVVIEISDTGPGIPAEVMKRLFSPFVTTKPAGVGTGLGLSISHRLITELNGEISAENVPGGGARFRITLPVAQEDTAEAPIAAAPASIPTTVRGKILVIDDEPMLVKVVERTLMKDHDVTTVQRAKDALDRIIAGERFDVILCDLMMPEMTGMDFHAEVLERHPQQAAVIIFLSGGAFTPRARSFLDEVPNQSIEKPFAPGDLLALINGRVRRSVQQ